MTEENSTLTGRDRSLADIAHYVHLLARQLFTAPISDERVVQLTATEGLVMQHVDRSPGIRVSDIATRLGLRSPNASTAVRELERKGMIRREPDAADRRATGIWPTDLARENLALIRAHWAEILDDTPATDKALETAAAVLASAEATLATLPVVTVSDAP